ncbi:MAG TPA: acyl carrier protein [Candidatus Sulfotelmatobacter sp.]|nr:acyl carrier protein [Candidatus Sulfotelmatobacter sp.]
MGNSVPTDTPVTAARLEQWLVGRIAGILEIPREQVGVDRPFAEFGMESVQLFELSGDLEEFVGRRLPETVVWDYPTIRQLSQYLTSPDSPAPGPTA